MSKKSLAVALVGAAAFSFSTGAVAAEMGEMQWMGSIYAKFLDGSKNRASGLYNSSEQGSGDQGQGIEFELLFFNQVSRQVEIGGRLKARFNTNYWTNFGGFAADELDPRSAQYMKFRGAYARITPGYDWLDSAHFGSHDLGLWDPFTVGKIRYIDRDNASGIILQGSGLEGDLRWDLARISLPKLWAGPGFNTGDFSAQDAAFVGQFKYSPSPDWSVGAIAKYIRDQEINAFETDVRDGTDNEIRYDNTVIGLKGAVSPADALDVNAAFYWSYFNNDDPEVFTFSPALNQDGDDTAWTINIDINDVGLEDLAFNIQLFDFGEDFISVMAARREADVLITEGTEGAWGWSRPDYNEGRLANEAARAQVGYGGWNGNAQQVMSLGADNDFTDFDETMAESVLGWRGFTIIPTYTIADWELQAEYSYIDFNTNWQACNGTSLAACDKYPQNEENDSWGVGGWYRSVFSEFKEREMQIFAINAGYSFDIGSGLDFEAKYKYMEDTDDRVTDPNWLAEAYGAATVGPDIDNVRYDDREAEYQTFRVAGGYQLTDDLYGKFIYERQMVDLIDGTIDVAPVGSTANDVNGWIEYLTGEHSKDRIGVEFNYFLSGVEFGLTADWIFGEYEPAFFRGVGGDLVRLIPDPNSQVVQTALGAIEVDTIDLKQYRLKAFMKVQF